MVFCYTDVDSQRVRDLGVTSRIEVVANGIDTERFTPEGPESDLINAEGPVVLFVGRFAEGMRPSLAVEAFAERREPGQTFREWVDGARGPSAVTELRPEEADVPRTRAV